MLLPKELPSSVNIHTIEHYNRKKKILYLQISVGLSPHVGLMLNC